MSTPKIQDCNEDDDERVERIARMMVELHPRGHHAQRLNALGEDFGKRLEQRVAKRVGALDHFSLSALQMTPV